MIKNFKEFFQYVLKIKGKSVVVVQPHNKESLMAIVDAKRLGLADFHLVGDELLIRQLLINLEADPADYFIYNELSIDEVIKSSFMLIHNKMCHVLMKGSIDTTTLMKAVLDPKNNLKTGSLFSDVFIFEYPPKVENKFIMITDGGLNLQPSLEDKIELINNAVRVANALGNSLPKVAILSASEKVNPKLQSSLDALELKRLNKEGKITNCIIDGPLALDLAISPESALEKNYESEVAGNADIIIAPSIEVANSLAKSTQYFAKLPHMQVIIGGIIPILIPSRADKHEEKLRTIALGILMSN